MLTPFWWWKEGGRDGDRCLEEYWVGNVVGWLSKGFMLNNMRKFWGRDGGQMPIGILGGQCGRVGWAEDLC